MLLMFRQYLIILQCSSTSTGFECRCHSRKMSLFASDGFSLWPVIQPAGHFMYLFDLSENYLFPEDTPALPVPSGGVRVFLTPHFLRIWM